VSRTSPSDLTYFPEPRLIDFLGSGYTVDRAATEAHHDRLFSGKTAAEVISFLEESGHRVRYPAENEISILIIKRVVFFEYKVGLVFFFEDGVFQRSKVRGTGWK
jgi:hypothetical protein